MMDTFEYKLLIVDDEPDLLELLVDDIKMELPNIFVETAKNGKLGYEFVLKEQNGGQPFDAILSDISMPEMTGLEMLEKIIGSNIEIPCVFLTGFGDAEKTSQALKLGAFDFFNKPYNRLDLCRAILRAVKKGKALRTFYSQLNVLFDNKALPEEQLKIFKEAQNQLMKLKIHKE